MAGRAASARLLWVPFRTIAIAPAAADSGAMSAASILPPTLPEIPIVDLGESPPEALAERHPDGAAELAAAARRTLPGPLLPLLDTLSRRWAARSANPYRDEVARLSARIGTGAWFMNFCFEWGCTTGVAPDPAGPGMRMLRTLDWPFHGVGRHVLVARQSGPAGSFLNLTWPGFVGVITAMAPGRFALAINQAPLVRRGYLPLAADWAANRVQVFRSRFLPPVHVARQAMETCRSYEEAKEMLETTPLALPAFFALAGAGERDGCIVERTETRAWVHPAPAAVANHWLTQGLKGSPRGNESRRRHRLMNGLSRLRCDSFDWMIEPILNKDTRLSVATNAATGALLAMGWERDGGASKAATAMLSHREPVPHPGEGGGTATSPLTWGTARV